MLSIYERGLNNKVSPRETGADDWRAAIAALDTRVLKWMNSRIGSSPWLDTAMVVAAQTLSFVEVALLLAMLPTCGTNRRAVPRVILSLVVATLLVKLLQALVKRPRPFRAEPGLRHLVHRHPGPSFPSRHVASAFAMGVAALPAQRTIGALMLLGGAILGVSRVYVAVHYPSDVLGGAVVGALCGWLFGASDIRSGERDGRTSRAAKVRGWPF